MASATEENLITVLETAKWLGVSKAKVHDLITSGKLKSMRIGTARRVSKQSVSDYMERELQPQTEENNAEVN